MKDVNNIAISTRLNLPSENNFTIRELSNKPKIFDFVNCCVDSNCEFLMFLANDDGVALRFFWNGFYERLAIKTWVKLSKKSSLILDIGAHSGAYTLAALKANPLASVVSFEPYFMNYARLNLNLRANGFETFNAFMLGVSDKTTCVNFNIGNNLDYLYSGGRIDNQNPNGFKVDVIDLDSFFKKASTNKIDLIKLDVEGHEFNCIHGGKELIKNSRPIMIFESTQNQDNHHLSNYFENYKFFVLDESMQKMSEVQEIKPIHDSLGQIDMNLINRLAVPVEKLSWIE